MSVQNKVRHYTKEQEEYRQSVLRKRQYNKKEKPRVRYEWEPPEDPIENKKYYINNCIWWLKEYTEGRCDYDNYIKALQGLNTQTADLLKLLNHECKP